MRHLNRNQTLWLLFASLTLLFLGLCAVALLKTSGLEPIKTRLERYTRWSLYGRPVVSLRIWGQPRRGILRVELFSPAKLVVDCGGRVEQQLSPAEFRRLAELAQQAAETDFCSLVTVTVPDGTNADIEILIEGKMLRVTCRGSPDWPGGQNTRQFLAEVNAHLNKETRVY